MGYPQLQQSSRQSTPVETLRAALSARFPGAIHSLQPPEPQSPRTQESSPLPNAIQRIEPLYSGQISEVINAPGSGGCSLVLRHIAEALKKTPHAQLESYRYATWIDLTGSFYPPAAATLGVPLRQLILIRPTDFHLALQAIEIVLRGGAAHSIVLDIPENTPAMKLGTYHRLKRRVRDSDCALCILTPHSIVPTSYRVVLDATPQANTHRRAG
jgi:hypothetical protein